MNNEYIGREECHDSIKILIKNNHNRIWYFSKLNKLEKKRRIPYIVL